MSALPGAHLCAEHQGNHSHYASHNCEICKLMTERDELAARLEAGKVVWRQDQARIAELAADRDELLAALHLALPALVQCERAYRSIGAAVGQGEFERALIKAQALIAKHKPPAAPAASTT